MYYPLQYLTKVHYPLQYPPIHGFMQYPCNIHILANNTNYNIHISGNQIWMYTLSTSIPTFINTSVQYPLQYPPLLCDPCIIPSNIHIFRNNATISTTLSTKNNQIKRILSTQYLNRTKSTSISMQNIPISTATSTLSLYLVFSS